MIFSGVSGWLQSGSGAGAAALTVGRGSAQQCLPVAVTGLDGLYYFSI